MSDTNYKCTVVRLSNLYSLEGLDRLKGTNIYGNQVLVGVDQKEGDLGLYFPPESQLGEEFYKANDLLRRKDEQGKPCGGMFEENRRVRVLKLKGHQSAGFWCPIEFIRNLIGYTSPTGIKVPDSFKTIESTLKEDDSFNELGGIEISKKYIPKTNQNNHTGLGNGQPKKEKSRIIKEFFPEHIDTEHLFKNLHKINIGNLLIFTWKLHGTSFRVGNVPVRRILNPLERVLKFFGVKIQQTEYANLNGSRKIVKDSKNSTQNHYYKKDLWTEIGDANFKDKLFMNEMVFGEIIGYVPGTEELIQKGFTYGCKPGTCEVYIYRITRDGIDLSWEAVKERSVELGVKHVTEVERTYVNLLSSEAIEDYVKGTYLETNSYLDPSHPEEGVVCRIEGLKPQFYKAKSFRFMEMETKQLDKGEQDLETIESEV